MQEQCPCWTRGARGSETHVHVSGKWLSWDVKPGLCNSIPLPRGSQGHRSRWPGDASGRQVGEQGLGEADGGGGQGGVSGRVWR